MYYHYYCMVYVCYTTNLYMETHCLLHNFGVKILIFCVCLWQSKSEEAAKEALIYSYKHAASGFSAKLTAEQVSELSKQPGVLQVVPSQTVQLHTGRV